MDSNFSLLVRGLSAALEPQNLLFALLGSLLGTLVGVLPGIGPTSAIALLLPLTSVLAPTPAVIMLAAIYYGAMYGGSTTAILINTPGEVSSVVTALDGYQLARQGKAGVALSISAIGSFVAGTLGVVALTFFAPALADVALAAGPPEYFALMLLALSVVVNLAGRSLWRGLAAAAAVLGGYALAAQLAFAWAGRWLHLFYPLTCGLGVTLVQLGYGYLTQERQKTVLRRSFQKYVPHEVVEQLLRNPQEVALGGERRPLSVLFSDIRGFTGLSERMNPEAVVRFLNSYFAVMTPIIYRHGGIVDKFEGDAIMALFGAPIFYPDHAVRAVRAALDMRAALAAMQSQWRAQLQLDRPLRIGVGIATGEAVVGNIGSPERLNYTAVGDTVNLAARLQELTKEFATDILVDEATYMAAREVVEAEAIPQVQVRGKTQLLTIYRVTGLRESRAQLPVGEPAEAAPGRGRPA